jgi:hypothetical protein
MVKIKGEGRGRKTRMRLMRSGWGRGEHETRSFFPFVNLLLLHELVQGLGLKTCSFKAHGVHLPT